MHVCSLVFLRSFLFVKVVCVFECFSALNRERSASPSSLTFSRFHKKNIIAPQNEEEPFSHILARRHFFNRIAMRGGEVCVYCRRCSYLAIVNKKKLRMRIS